MVIAVVAIRKGNSKSFEQAIVCKCCGFPVLVVVVVQVIPVCSRSNNQRAVAVVATMANCFFIVLAMAIFCRKVETCSGSASSYKQAAFGDH